MNKETRSRLYWTRGKPKSAIKSTLERSPNTSADVESKDSSGDWMSAILHLGEMQSRKPPADGRINQDDIYSDGN